MFDESNTKDGPISDDTAPTKEEVATIEAECAKQHMAKEATESVIPTRCSGIYRDICAEDVVPWIGLKPNIWILE